MNYSEKLKREFVGARVENCDDHVNLVFYILNTQDYGWADSTKKNNTNKKQVKEQLKRKRAKNKSNNKNNKQSKQDKI